MLADLKTNPQPLLPQSFASIASWWLDVLGDGRGVVLLLLRPKPNVIRHTKIFQDFVCATVLAQI